MRGMAWIVGVACWTSAAWGQTTVEEKIEQVRELRRAEVAAVEAELPKLKKELVEARKDKNVGRIKRVNDDIKAHPAKLKAARQGMRFPGLAPLKKGAFGMPDAPIVLQVLGKEEAIVRLETLYEENGVVNNLPATRLRTHQETAILRGVSTEGWTDGRPAKIDRVVEAVGTETRGTRTMWALRAVPEEDVAAIRKALDEDGKPKGPPEPVKPTEVEVDGLGQPVRKPE